MKNLAIIGTGVIGRQHAETISNSPSAEVTAVVDPAESARQFAAEFGTRHFSSHHDLLSDGGIDGLVIATPNALHVPVALDAIAAGLPVLIEKPIADTLESARTVVEASRLYDVPVLVGHHRRYSPDISGARHAVETGRLGEITVVNGMWLTKKPDDYFDVQWRRSTAGGMYLINLIHELDSLRYIVGDILSVFAAGSNRTRGFEGDDAAGLVVRFENGVVGTIAMSDASPSPWMWDTASGMTPQFPHTPSNSLFIGGTHASLAVPSLQIWEHNEGESWMDPLEAGSYGVKDGSPYERQIEHFLEVIDGRESPLIDAHDGMLTLATTLAAVRSSHDNREVKIDEIMAIGLI